MKKQEKRFTVGRREVKVKREVNLLENPIFGCLTLIIIFGVAIFLLWYFSIEDVVL
jgi:hypothetical protein